MPWSVSEASARLSALLADAHAEPQVIEDHGVALAVVLSIADYQRLQSLASAAPPPAMQTWLATVDAFKAGDDLSLTLPERAVEDRDDPALGDD